MINFFVSLAFGRCQESAAWPSSSGDASIRIGTFETRSWKSSEPDAAHLEDLVQLIEPEGLGSSVLRRRLTVRYSNSAYVEKKGWDFNKRTTMPIA